MGETGVIHLQRSLDPAAREFRPANFNNLVTVLGPPLRHVYYSFPTPLPPPINHLQLDPFRNSAVAYTPMNLPVNFNPVEEIAVVPPVQPLSSGPTRSLLLSGVPTDVSESVVRSDLEGFGDLRGVQMERIRDAIVTVHFYDLRHAERAFREMRNQHLMRQKQHSWFSPPRFARALVGGCAVWADFVIPASNAAVPDGNNQGTIIVFNLEVDVSASTLNEIFQCFGPVKEFRETPLKRHQRFIEFFDVRDASKAVKEMNGKEIHGKPVVVEFHRPDGQCRKFINPMIATPHHHPPSLAQPLKLSGRLNNPIRPFYPQAQFSSKKLHYTSDGRSLSCAEKPVDKSQPLNCSGSTGSEIERRDSVSTWRRTSAKKIMNRQSPPNLKQEAFSQTRITIKLRRNNFLKRSDPCFLISENAMEKEASDCRDSRTTVMIKNIPNKYSLKLLMKTLDKHCMECNEEIAKDGNKKDLPLSSYDFVYLPIDFKNKCNVGYGFVNMTSPQGAWRLYKSFHLHPWQVFNSRKICQVTYARLQGLEALKEHFRNSKFPKEMEQFELPVVFWPPRDGIQVTEPLAVAGKIVHVDGDGGNPSDADESSEVVPCTDNSNEKEEDS